MAELELWLKSIETSFSSVVSSIFFNSFFEANIKESLIFFSDNLFFELNTKSTNETFGVGTLNAKPSSFVREIYAYKRILIFVVASSGVPFTGI